MGRGRGKGKKQSAIARDENVITGDEKLPVRRRGRPHKVTKDEIALEYEVANIDDEECDRVDQDTKGSATGVNPDSLHNRKKRKTCLQVKENAGLVKEENGLGSNGSMNSVGFRQNGSRRKNKPRRAAEVGVECK